MAIPFPNGCVQRFGLVLAGIPEYLEMLLRAISFGIKRCIHPMYDILIRATLKGDHLALVIETEVEIKRHLNPSLAGVQSTRNDGRSIERWSLTTCTCRLSSCSPRVIEKWNRHEDTPFRVTHGANPSNVLWELADLVMSRTYTPKQLSTICKATHKGRGPLPVGHLLTIAIGTG